MHLIIKQSNRKPNKIWVDQGGEFYNNVFKKWFSDNDIIMYSTYNEGKPVVAERFIRTLNDTVPYTYNVKDLNDEEIIGSFYDSELQKTKL